MTVKDVSDLVQPDVIRLGTFVHEEYRPLGIDYDKRWHHRQPSALDWPDDYLTSSNSDIVSERQFRFGDTADSDHQHS